MVVRGRAHPEDDDAASRREGADDRVECGVYGCESGGGVDGRRVQDDSGGPVGACHDLRSAGGEDGAEFVREGGVPGGEVEDRAGEGLGLQGPAAQRGGLGQAESPGQESAGGCAGQVQIAVGHCPDSLLGRRFTPE